MVRGERDDLWRQTFFALAASFLVSHLLAADGQRTSAVVCALIGMALLLRIDPLRALRDAATDVLRQRLGLNGWSLSAVAMRVLTGYWIDLPSPAQLRRLVEAWRAFQRSAEYDVLARCTSFLFVLVFLRTVVGEATQLRLQNTLVTLWHGPGDGVVDKILVQIVLARKPIAPPLLFELTLVTPLVYAAYYVGYRHRATWIISAAAAAFSLSAALRLALPPISHAGVSVTPEPDAVTVATPNLPPNVSEFLHVRSLTLPKTISRRCGFNPTIGRYPFLAAGDFDGDGEVDYAVIARTDGAGATFVLLASGKVHTLDEWDYIETDPRRGSVSTLEGPVFLARDALHGVRCESSDVLYVYRTSTSRFDRLFTGD